MTGTQDYKIEHPFSWCPMGDMEQLHTLLLPLPRNIVSAPKWGIEWMLVSSFLTRGMYQRLMKFLSFLQIHHSLLRKIL
jgi:hypothetical protein